jgi:hypothetical protein
MSELDQIRKFLPGLTPQERAVLQKELSVEEAIRDDQLDITAQEQQFLEFLREWDTMPEDYQVVIEHVQGVWDATTKELGTKRVARGTGASFDEAWNNMEPTQFEP